MTSLRLPSAAPAAVLGLAATLWLSGPPAAHAQQFGGMTGTSGMSGGSTGRTSTAGRGTSGAGGTSTGGFDIGGLELGTSLGGSSLGGSTQGGVGGRSGTFGSNTQFGTFGSGSQFGAFGQSSYTGISTINPFYSFFMVPTALGMPGNNGSIGNTSFRFGSPLYSNLGMTSQPMSGSMGGSLGRSGSMGGSGMRMGGTSSLGGAGSVLSMNSSMGGMGGMGGMGSRTGGMGGMRTMGTGSSLGRTQTYVRMDLTPDLVRPAVAGPARIPTVGSRVLADAQQVLLSSERLPSRGNIRVGVDGGTLVLQGVVGDDYQRRLAEAMIRLTPGVRDIRNDLVLEGEALPAPQPLP